MYDLLINSLSKKRATRLRVEGISIKLVNRRPGKQQKYYDEIWPFINNAYGILYKVFTKEGLGTFECCDELFEFDWEHRLEPISWEPYKKIGNVLYEECESIKLSKRYEAKFVTALNILLSQSPISMVAFLCRGQGFDNEIILGNIAVSEFITMLYTGNVYTNVCYLISKDEAIYKAEEDEEDNGDEIFYSPLRAEVNTLNQRGYRSSRLFCDILGGDGKG